MQIPNGTTLLWENPSTWANLFWAVSLESSATVVGATAGKFKKTGSGGPPQEFEKSDDFFAAALYRSKHSRHPYNPKGRKYQ